MKTYNQKWNFDALHLIPTVNEKIIIDFRNGMGSDRRYPYLVETITEHERGDFKVFYAEGRQLRKDETLKNNWFQLIFTNKPKAHIGWYKEVA